MSTDRQLVVNRTVTADDVVVFDVSGEVDAAGGDELGLPIVTAIRERHRLVVVDLGRVTFLDSSGISVMLAVHRIADGRGQRYVFVLPPGSFVFRLAEGLGVTQLLSHVGSLTEALAG